MFRIKGFILLLLTIPLTLFVYYPCMVRLNIQQDTSFKVFDSKTLIQIIFGINSSGTVLLAWDDLRVRWVVDGPIAVLRRQLLRGLECGANAGVELFISDTIEQKLNPNWTGLFIECSSPLSKALRQKNRNAWVADICLSTDTLEQIEFRKHNDTVPSWMLRNGKINSHGKYAARLDACGQKRQNYKCEGIIDCFPLWSGVKGNVPSGIDDSSVDFFDLDVEGEDYKILVKAIPFNLVDKKVILLEHFLEPEVELAIKALFEENGYKVFSRTDADIVFYKNNEFNDQC